MHEVEYFDGAGHETLFTKPDEVVMRSLFFTGVGGVLSADIAVPDHERELGFYSQILTTGPAPLWRADLTNNEGTPIIGLAARTPEHAVLPLQWMPHVQVADVAASAARALALGGKELMHGKDADGQSQWAVLVDPAGAAFGVVQVVDDASIAAIDRDSIGCIAWLSLFVADVETMCEFYEQVIGWSAAPGGAQGVFDMRGPDGVAAAEIRPTSDSVNIPPAWIISLPVADFAESLRRVRAGGGRIVREAPAAGYAVIQDPIGVYIGLQARQ